MSTASFHKSSFIIFFASLWITQSYNSFQYAYAFAPSSSRTKTSWYQEKRHSISFQHDFVNRKDNTRIMKLNLKTDENEDKIYDKTDEKQEKQRLEVWANRRKQIRATLKSAETNRNDRIADGALDNPENESSSGSALAITAFVIAFGAVILRVGGRTALVSTLGLDFAQENPELQTQLDSFLAYTNGLPIGLELLFFTLAWTAVKVFCFDAGGIVLALSAGLLFGGVFQGAVASAAAATIASSVAFGLAKIDSPVRKKALEVLEEYPSLRGIEKVVAKDGVKAILTLRLAPVLPIPIGLYNYIYGVTNVPYFDFSAGIFLGSLKPYLLDSYLGYFGKSLVEGGGNSETEDAILLVALGVSTLIGVFASQLASETWEAVQKEVEAEKAASDNGDGKQDDGITRSFLGLDLPEWVVGFQLAIKAAEGRMEETVAAEIEAKVWNYTEPELIPEELDPAKATDSPEIIGAYKGFEFVNAICDGLVLSPVLFSLYSDFADPFFDEEKKLKEISRKTNFQSNSESLTVTAESESPTNIKASSAIIEPAPTMNVSNEDIDKYLIDTLENTKTKAQKKLDELKSRIKNV